MNEPRRTLGDIDGSKARDAETIADLRQRLHQAAAALRLVELWRNSSYQGEALYIAPYKFLQPDGGGWRVTHSITGDFEIYASLALALAAVDGDGGRGGSDP